MTERDVFIIGAPYSAASPVDDIPGTRIIECEHCKKGTRFSPFSLSRPEARTGKFICLPCAMKLPDGLAEIAPIAPEQIRELTQALKEAVPDPDYAASLPAFLRPAVRANVIEGFRQVNHYPMPVPDVSGVLAVIIADDESVSASVMPRAQAVGVARRFNVELSKLEHFLTLIEPDSMGVLILTPQGEGFHSIRVKFIHLKKPQGAAD